MNVTARYAALAEDTNSAATAVHVRLREKDGGERLTAAVELRSAGGILLATNHTRAGTADMNDMPDFTLPKNATSVAFRFVRGNEARLVVDTSTEALAAVPHPTKPIAT